ITAAYPDFVDLLVLTIHAGRTPSQAVRALSSTLDGPLGAALAAVTSEVDHGQRFDVALAALVASLGPVAQPVVDALTLAMRAGVPLAATLDRLAVDAHAQRRRAAEASARQLPVRLSFPLVGLTLPSFVVLAIVPLLAGTLSSLGGLSPHTP
ncbi:MAG TPA: type II secretion system F family protein, partial [Ilumatobacteraceae bacterium]|nr:type II secretion system F family protein [Ilumatobacteraceae bacterium]